MSLWSNGTVLFWQWHCSYIVVGTYGRGSGEECTAEGNCNYITEGNVKHRQTATSQQSAGSSFFHLRSPSFWGVLKLIGCSGTAAQQRRHGPQSGVAALCSRCPMPHPFYSLYQLLWQPDEWPPLLAVVAKSPLPPSHCFFAALVFCFPLACRLLQGSSCGACPFCLLFAAAAAGAAVGATATSVLAGGANPSTHSNRDSAAECVNVCSFVYAAFTESICQCPMGPIAVCSPLQNRAWFFFFFFGASELFLILYSAALPKTVHVSSHPPSVLVFMWHSAAAAASLSYFTLHCASSSRWHLHHCNQLLHYPLHTTHFAIKL